MRNENPLRQDAAAYTVQVLPEEQLKEQQERYAQLLERLGPPSVAATEAFLAARETAEADQGLTDELAARVEARIEAARREENHP